MEKRRKAIRDMVNQLGEINFDQLREMFPKVSDVTLRKDLKYLDETQQLIRIHGGAKSLPHAVNYHFRSSVNHEEKREIAVKASGLISAHDSIFMTAGTTCIELAQSLPLVPLYVFTDGILTASSFPCSKDINVEIFGGEVDLNVMRVGGPSVLDALENLRFNIAFLGTPGFHPDYGFAVLSSSIAAIFQKVIERSDKVVMLMDSSKVNYSYTPKMIPMDDVDVVVSDDKLDPQIRKKLEAKGITVL
ncbi:MAG: DeoR/GlpR transcriptional regulator [Firmicutes bacterium]|nr:DeoR/GlpR transcriptional regulator [Bacillota bacterium]MBQ6686806.1 DeoR/GlpR transcriptional regulator [Bacillota bacterium]